MKVVVLGASGMVGQGVLLECLESPDVEKVLSVGRGPLGRSHPKLQELTVKDFFQLGDMESQLAGYDACFFCLGVSSAGMKEPAYRKVTYDLTLSFAQALLRHSPQAIFCYVSGQSTDSSGKGRTMWARVKGQTENALLAMTFRGSYMFRPGLIKPMKGVRTKTRLYAAIYAVLNPLYPALKAAFPGSVTTSENVGLAMLRVARVGAAKRVLENPDINELARAQAT